MTAKSSALIQSRERLINKYIENGSYYDASQMMKAMIYRYTESGEHKVAINSCRKFAMEFVHRKQHALAATIGQIMIQVLVEFEESVNDLYICYILNIFKEQEYEPTNEGIEFMEKSLNWIYTSDVKEKKVYARQLHISLAHACIEKKMFGDAQTNLIAAFDVDEMVSLLKTWFLACYVNEKDLLVLRLILILLATRQILYASMILHHEELKYDFDDYDCPLPIQCAYLILEACKVSTPDFFNTVVNKYNLVIRRDPDFQKLLGKIEESYFGKTSTGKYYRQLIKLKY